MLSGEVANTNFIIFSLMRSGIEPTIYCTRGQHSNHYTSDAVICVYEDNERYFYFQFKKMHIAVELGGGLPVLLEEKWKNDRMLVEKGSVVMHCEPSQCTQVLSQDSNNWVLHVQSYLRK
jgi:hypothetical protein